MRRILFLLLVFANSIITFAQSTSDDLPKDLQIKLNILNGKKALSMSKYDDALSFFTKAFELGDKYEASFQLGRLYVYGQGAQTDYKKAAYYYGIAAENNHAEAQCMYATMCHMGIGIQQDDNDAFKWYTKSANQGYDEAQYCLGMAYYNGEGVDKNIKMAVKWYAEAAKQGHIHAQNNLGQCLIKGEGVSQNIDEGLKWVTESANKGNADAQCSLGSYYEYGAYGIKKDVNLAIFWYKKAAAQGISYAQMHLAQLGENY